MKIFDSLRNAQRLPSLTELELPTQSKPKAVNHTVLKSKAFYAFLLCPTNVKLEVKGYHIIEGLAIYIGKDNY